MQAGNQSVFLIDNNRMEQAQVSNAVGQLLNIIQIQLPPTWIDRDFTDWNTHFLTSFHIVPKQRPYRPFLVPHCYGGWIRYGRCSGVAYAGNMGVPYCRAAGPLYCSPPAREYAGPSLAKDACKTDGWWRQVTRLPRPIPQ